MPWPGHGLIISRAMSLLATGPRWLAMSARFLWARRKHWEEWPKIDEYLYGIFAQGNDGERSVKADMIKAGYDLTTNMWHERNYTDSNNDKFMHKGTTQDFFNGKVYVGDWSNGNIYELNPDTYTDNGDEIHRERACPHIWNNMDRVFYGSFQLDIQVAVGLNGDGQGSNPHVMLDVSNDGGNTFGSEHWLRS